MIFRKGETHDSMEMSTKDVGLKAFENKDGYLHHTSWLYLFDKTANHILDIICNQESSNTRINL